MRKPRHRFAAPLVMVAVLPGCIGTSNPPPPRQEPIVNEEPDPEPSGEDRTWTVYADQNGACHFSVDTGCPPMAPCNPPPPRPMTCPEGVDPGEQVTVVSYAGREDCVILPPPSNCPEDVPCNPPPPRKTACPE